MHNMSSVGVFHLSLRRPDRTFAAELKPTAQMGAKTPHVRRVIET